MRKIKLENSSLAEYIRQVNIKYKKKESVLNLFWGGVILFFVSVVLINVSSYNTTIIRSFQVVGLILILSSLFPVFENRFDSKYIKFIFYTFFIWQFFILIRGNWEFNYFILFDKSLNTRGALMYIIPFIILYPKDILSYRKILNILAISGLLYLLTVIFFINQVLDFNNRDAIEYLSKNLGIGCGLILLTYSYNKKKINIIAIVVIVLTIILAAYKARRSLLFMNAEYIFFSFLLYFVFGKKQTLNRFVILVITSISFILVYQIYENNRYGTFKALNERLNEDSRSTVEELWWDDFSNKTIDIVIGRGMDGSYAQDMYDSYGILLGEKRDGIETGYLNLILKGGIINVLLILLIAIPAIYKGIFASKNLFSKAAAMMIVIWLIDMYPDANPSHFSIRYILFWICVGICYSTEIRNIPESILKRVFRS